MLFDDTYKTISAFSEGNFSDRGSKFTGYAYPLTNEEEIREIISAVHAQHTRARHHCWAYRLTIDRSVFRLNDDGEPSGSAGRPILNTLLSYDVTNILVIVVRYFGGKLLGIPGLIRAYKIAAAEALNAAEIIQKTIDDVYRVEFNYPDTNAVMNIIKDTGLQIIKQQFATACTIDIRIRKSQVNMIIGKFNKIPGASLLFLYTL